jgi:hypothetical protein
MSVRPPPRRLKSKTGVITVAKPIVLGGLLLGVLLTGCSRSDPRLEKLTVGIARDSALALMGVEKPARIDAYLVNGHYIEGLYFKKLGADAAIVADRKMSPVVVVDGRLVGWGWKRWDSIAVANKIAVAK